MPTTPRTRTAIRTSVQATQGNMSDIKLWLGENYGRPFVVGEYYTASNMRIIIYTDGADWTAFVLKNGELFDKFKDVHCDTWTWSTDRMFNGVSTGELIMITAGRRMGKSMFNEMYLGVWESEDGTDS